MKMNKQPDIDDEMTSDISQIDDETTSHVSKHSSKKSTPCATQWHASRQMDRYNIKPTLYMPGFEGFAEFFICDHPEMQQTAKDIVSIYWGVKADEQLNHILTTNANQ